MRDKYKDGGMGDEIKDKLYKRAQQGESPMDEQAGPSN